MLVGRVENYLQTLEVEWVKRFKSQKVLQNTSFETFRGSMGIIGTFCFLEDIFVLNSTELSEYLGSRGGVDPVRKLWERIKKCVF